jgi:hypothetical protein
MFQSQLISSALVWERILEIEDEKRKDLRLEPYRELPFDIQPRPIESEFILTQAPSPCNEQAPGLFDCPPEGCGAPA